MFPYIDVRSGTPPLQPLRNKRWYVVIMGALTLMFLYDVLQIPPENDPRFTAIGGVVDAQRWNMQQAPVLNISGEWRFSEQNTDINTPVDDMRCMLTGS